MARTLSFTEELVVEVCWCGMHHAIPKQHPDGEAREAACQRAFDTSVLGRRECYQIGRLVLNDEVYDPADHTSARAASDQHVNEK